MNTARDYNSELKDTADHKYGYSFDFDVMHPYMIRAFQPFFRQGNFLELGSYKGNFTQRFTSYFDDITCVEASDDAIREAKITLGDKVLGVLDVQQNVKDGLREEDATLLQSIAYQVAVAVRNAQVFSEAQQQAEREALINEIGRKIQNTASVEQALQVAARELGQAIGARDTHAIIDLHNTLITKAN